jgi:hypothetical protein
MTPDLGARLGRICADGSRLWPDADAHGQPYSQPASTVDMGGDCFIVLPASGRVDGDAIEALAAFIDGLTAPEESDDNQL